MWNRRKIKKEAYSVFFFAVSLFFYFNGRRYWIWTSTTTYKISQLRHAWPTCGIQCCDLYLNWQVSHKGPDIAGLYGITAFQKPFSPLMCWSYTSCKTKIPCTHNEIKISFSPGEKQVYVPVCIVNRYYIRMDKWKSSVLSISLKLTIHGDHLCFWNLRKYCRYHTVIPTVPRETL